VLRTWPQPRRWAAAGNEFINLLKATSLVSVIAGGDLLTNAQTIYAKNFLVLELLAVVSIWYLELTTVATVGVQVPVQSDVRLDVQSRSYATRLGAAGGEGGSRAGWGIRRGRRDVLACRPPALTTDFMLGVGGARPATSRVDRRR
jgi:hypothetical protein